MYFIQETVPKIICTTGGLNGGSNLFSAAAPVKRQVLSYCFNFTFQISRTYCDPERRFIICDVTTVGKQLTLVNLYAPKDDDTTFFTSVFEHLTDFKCDDIIIGGDYKLVLEVEKNKKSGLAKTHKKSLEVINSFCGDLDLFDRRLESPKP